MPRTTITYEPRQIDEAARILGTSGLSETIREALNRVIRRSAAERIRARMAGPSGAFLRDPDFERQAWG